MTPALLLLACQTGSPPPELPAIQAGEAAAMAAEVLCRTAAGDCQAQGAVATLGDHALRFSATVTNSTSLAPRTIGMGSAKQDVPGEVQLGVEYELSLGDRSLLTGKVTHAASDPDLEQARRKVIDEAAQRFVTGHALGLVDALRGDPQAATLARLGLPVAAQPLLDGTWRAWASYPVLRGQGLDPDMVQRMAPQVKSMVLGIAPYLEDRAAELHVVEVKAKLGSGTSACGIVPQDMPVDGATVRVVPLSGTVTVDGVTVPDGDEPAICALADGVAWPLPATGYSLEWTQVVVAQPQPAGD